MANAKESNDKRGAAALDGDHALRLPPPRQDVLSQILTLIRLRGETVYRGELGGGSGIVFPIGPAHFYVVQQGRLVIIPASSEPVELKKGDLVLLPRGNGHTISECGVSGSSAIEYLRPEHFDTDKNFLRGGGNTSSAARFISGSFRFDGNPLASVLSALPVLIHIPGHADGAPAWLNGITKFLLEEADESGPGSSLMISRLIDLLVIRALRTWAVTRTTNLGWLGGMNDKRIARVLSAMHDDPQRNWTLEALAKLAAMSRSLFAERFLATVGETPLRYLSRWRLTLAADLLKTGRLKVTEVAQRSGYHSDAAFSRAFKAQFGYPPSDANRL